MIIGLYDRVMMRHQHFVTTDDRANRRATRQTNLLDCPTHDTRLILVTVSHSFDRLGGAASQRMNFDHIATTNVCE